MATNGMTTAMLREDGPYVNCAEAYQKHGAYSSGDNGHGLKDWEASAAAFLERQRKEGVSY